MTKYLRYALAVFNVIWLIGAVIYTAYVWIFLPLDGRSTLYWFHQSIHCIPQMILLIFALNGILIVVFLLLSVRNKQRVSAFTLLPIVGLVSISCVFSCIASLPTVLGGYTFHDELRTPQHIYRLDSEWKVGVGGASTAIYNLWECDVHGWICRIVHSESVPPIYSQDAYESAIAELEQNTGTGAIEIYLDGTSVYSYPELQE